jgi:hypothetical protein
MNPHSSFRVVRKRCSMCTNPVLRCFDNPKRLNNMDLPLWAIPNTSLWGLCDLREIQVGVEWDPLCEHLSFVNQSLWHLLFLEVKPPRRLVVTIELSRLWWAVEKFVKACFTSARKKQKLSGVGKAVEREPTWSWLLVGNSSFINGDVRITSGWFQTSVNKSLCRTFGLPRCVLAYWFA